MSAGLVFITGASGFIGCTTALEALKAGYRLRLSVRNKAQIPKIQHALASYSDNVEFVVIPDITKLDAFAGHLHGVEYILHIASPLPKGTTKEDYFPGAVNGTTAILSEAAQVSSIKRVVITSSIVSLVPLGGPPTTDDAVSEHNDNWNTTISADLPIFDESANPNPWLLYQASKLLSLQAAESLVSNLNPGFDLVTIHPALVCGPDILQSSAAEIGGSNGMLFSAIMNGGDSANAVALTLVHVHDVAEAHVKALKKSSVSAGRYLVSLAGGQTWSDVVAVLKNKFPGEGWKLSEESKGQGWKVDTSKAERVLGIKARGLEDIVTDTVEQQLRLLKSSST